MDRHYFSCGIQLVDIQLSRWTVRSNSVEHGSHFVGDVHTAKVWERKCCICGKASSLKGRDYVVQPNDDLAFEIPIPRNDKQGYDACFR